MRRIELALYSYPEINGWQLEVSADSSFRRPTVCSYLPRPSFRVYADTSDTFPRYGVPYFYRFRGVCATRKTRWSPPHCVVVDSQFDPYLDSLENALIEANRRLRIYKRDGVTIGLRGNNGRGGYRVRSIEDHGRYIRDTTDPTLREVNALHLTQLSAGSRLMSAKYEPEPICLAGPYYEARCRVVNTRGQPVVGATVRIVRKRDRKVLKCVRTDRLVNHIALKPRDAALLYPFPIELLVVAEYDGVSDSCTLSASADRCQSLDVSGTEDLVLPISAAD
jgi:hypothetical protein